MRGARFVAGACAASLFVLWGCGGTGPAGVSGPSGSPAGGQASGSHNAGRDCLGCHSFGVAGTVYRDDGATPYAGARVRLVSPASAAERVDLTLTADASGNFFTNQRLSFGAGLSAQVTGTAGGQRTMGTPAPSGRCNSCHDSLNRIRAD
jgi:hypothetical protein